MPSRNGSGLADRSRDREPREIEHLGGRLDATNTPQAAARQAVDDLIANGAELHYRPASGDLFPSFTYELRTGGDRQRCRAIINEVRPQPLVWTAVLREIALREAVDGLNQ